MERNMSTDNKSAQIFFKSDIQDDLSVSVNVLKHLYMSMLVELPKEKIIEFWNQHPFEFNEGLFKGRQLLESLWEANVAIPLKYQLKIFNDLEIFLEKDNVSLKGFLDSFYNKVYKGRFHSASSWLIILKPYFRRIFEEKDLRHWLLAHFNEFNEEFYEHSAHEMIHDSLSGQMRKSVMLYSVDNVSEQPLDYETWVLPWVVQCPNILGMKSYEHVRMLADARRLDQITSIDISEHTATFNGDVIGTVIKFKDWVDKNHFDLDYLGLVDLECVLCEVDMLLPSGKSLQQGCIYGAPVYLTEFRYRENQKAPENPLADLIDAVVSEEEQIRSNISQIHNSLLQELLPQFNIKYYEKDESLSINGVHFIRNVPAKIFAKIIDGNLNENQTIFEHREFKRDSSICYDSSNPNFEGRLARLMKKLEAEYPSLAIQKTDRGLFEFNPPANIEYEIIKEN